MTAVTFDVDFTDYTSAGKENLDEIEASFVAIRGELERLPAFRATWFVRLDAHIGHVYGRADYILRRHAGAFDWLRSRGHEIAWHHHAFEQHDGEWRPTADDAVVAEQLRAESDLARHHGLGASRMGWGFHTNRTMAALDELGWQIDSTALPRPSYPWDALPRDWSVSPQHPYHPSRADYRVPGTPARALLEIPMTTVLLSSRDDSQPGVVRYVNPAYRPETFAEALSKVPAAVEPVLICHPYELVPSRSTHSMIAFDIGAFRSNLELLVARGDVFSTISEVAARAGAFVMPSSHQ